MLAAVVIFNVEFGAPWVTVAGLNNMVSPVGVVGDHNMTLRVAVADDGPLLPHVVVML